MAKKLFDEVESVARHFIYIYPNHASHASYSNSILTW